MPGEPEHHTPDQNVDEFPDTESGQVSSEPLAEPPLNPDPSPGSPTDVGRHLLGPHVVGQRLVIRRLIPGQLGPTGGPAFTDTLGVCVSWGDELVVLHTADGSAVTIEIAHIVSGKPVPPRPSIRSRVSAADAERHVVDLWHGDQVEVDGWTIRRTPAGPDGRLRKRGNSMLAISDPHHASHPASASEQAIAHYRAHGQIPYAAVEPEAPAEAALLALGWRPLAEGASLMLLAPVSRAVRRAAQKTARRTAQKISVEADETDESMQAAIRVAGEVVARGRAVLTGRATGADWVGIEDLWVATQHRRTGLAHVMVGDLLDWAASRGAMTAWLHVEESNEAARALYAGLGFDEHHRMRYLQFG